MAHYHLQSGSLESQLVMTGQRPLMDNASSVNPRSHSGRNPVAPSNTRGTSPWLRNAATLSDAQFAQPHNVRF
jgi:hypothetical protein